jgi:hypothetical protein
MKRTILLIAVPAVVCVCAFQVDAQNRIMRSEPPLGVLAHRNQGEAVFTEFDELTEFQARILQLVVVDKDFSIPAGTLLNPNVDQKGQARFCTRDAKKRVMGMAVPRDVCLYQDGSALQFGTLATQTVGSVINHRNPLKPSVGFERVEHFVDGSTSDARYEVLFSGAGGGVMRLLYREFSHDLARPAFSQELTYDLPPAGETLTVTVKGARFEITKAGNSGLDYRVLDGFTSR